MLKDANGAVSAVQSAELKELWIKGDLNDDGVVDLTDVSQLLDKITADEDVLLAVGDINGDILFIESGKLRLDNISVTLVPYIGAAAVFGHIIGKKSAEEILEGVEDTVFIVSVIC